MITRRALFAALAGLVAVPSVSVASGNSLLRDYPEIAAKQRLWRRCWESVMAKHGCADSIHECRGDRIDDLIKEAKKAGLFDAPKRWTA